MRSHFSQTLVRSASQAWTLACGLYFLWEALNYRGLTSRVAEIQIARFGSYVPLLTYLFLLCLCAVPAVILARLLLKRAERDMPDAELHELRWKQARQLRRWLVGLGAIACCVAAGFLAYASFALPRQEGELQTIAASELGAVPVKEGPARLVGGELGTIIFFGQDWLVGDDRMAFSPYRSASSGDGLAHIFVQLETNDKADAGKITQRPSWSGILVERGLPGPVRVLFNYVGVGMATPYYTLYQSEYALKVGYWLQALQWALLAVFFAFLVAFQSHVIRKIEKARDHMRA
jgi:hypothetical protein